MDNRVAAQGSGPFRNGATTHTSYSAFDPSVSSINSYTQGSSASSYTVRGVETLAGIAASLWGTRRSGGSSPTRTEGVTYMRFVDRE